MDVAHMISSGAKRLPAAPTFLTLASRPDIISFASGVPDPELFPFAKVQAGAAAIFADPVLRRNALQYAPSVGYLPLRQSLAESAALRGVSAGADDIIITNGAQQGLDLVAKLLIDPGDLIALTVPTFFAALDTFRPYRPEFVGIPIEGGELDMRELERVVRRRPKFLYMIPDFQNPTGLSLTVEQRRQLVSFCAEADVIILEDAAYDHLSFAGSFAPSLLSIAQALDASRRATVIHLSTASKTVAPGLRVGWIIAPPELRSRLAALKLASDVHTSLLNQMLVLRIFEESFDEHVDLIRAAYASRCDAMIDALKSSMPPGVTWVKPDGGIFVWLEMPSSIDADVLLDRCLRQHGVAFVPGTMSHFNEGGSHSFRLSFATVSEEQIRVGVLRLAAGMRAELEQREVALAK